jgi:glucose-6-phosphate 1-dehydrogenase
MKTKLLIFGITGDLSTRKLLPALEQIVATHQFDDVSVIGVSRRELDVGALLTSTLGSTTLLSRVSGFSMDVSLGDDYARLKDFIALGDDEQLLVYLSVPPAASGQIIELLGQAGLNTPNVKLLLEKPFGMDLSSAQSMIDHVANHYDESQVYRIDHYLAKEMTQNIVAFRGGNALFSYVWNNQAIEKIEVVAQESIGIEGRTEFYEPTGALRDVLQGHLMQLLATTLMDVPHDFDWTGVALLREELLDTIELADPSQAVRGQYDGYRTEVGNPDSVTETFASVVLQSRDPRWTGVPLVLATGKAMDKKLTEVRIHFKKSHEAQTNCLIFRIQPHEGVEIEVFTKKPGYDREFETHTLSFMYPENTVLPDAYEQVIVDAIRSHKSLFASSGEVLRSWEILQPVQQAWTASDDIKEYPTGSDLYTLLA